MSNGTAPINLPNPFTPLAFLEPDVANSLEVARYLCVVALGGYIWDVAINLANDYRLLFKYRIHYPTVAYYLSRISTMGYMVTSTVFLVGNVPNCEAVQIGVGVFYILSTGFTSFLFLLRVVAVWNRNKWIMGIFTVLWLATVGVAVTAPVGIGEGHIGTTQACLFTRVAVYTESTAITSMIYDSAVFLAITYRILVNSLYEENPSAQFKTFIGSGRSFLPTLSRNLLRSGQHYYLVALSGNIVNLVMLKVPNIALLYHAMCSIPVIAIVNSMACIVYRQIKFGLISVDGTVNYQSFGTSRFGADPTATTNEIPLHNPIRFRPGVQDTSNGTSFTLHSSDGQITVPSKVQVSITKDQESHYDRKPNDVV
ncbi:hypothetical protein L218DRAFT_1080953 [Marasmius fiardii PR-910]|nr:hypothetical protein L218DRAFT_1080953 [Marasmius fiardii PR-910]